MALIRLKGKEQVSLIHHSDRGCQYANSEYVHLLKSHNILISMTETGNPKDNAQAERINNTVKNELLKGKRFVNIRQVIDAVGRAVAFYNDKRPHMSISMLTPAEVATYEGTIKKKWMSYREKAIKEKRYVNPFVLLEAIKEIKNQALENLCLVYR